MKLVRKIDTNGLFVEDVILDDDTTLPPNLINTPVPGGFYRPKWTGKEWIEGMSQEEIDALNNQPIELTEIEKLKISQAEQFETILELLGGMM